MMLTTRNFHKFSNSERSGRKVRQKFLDFFIKKHDHHFIRSSPVVPFNDQSIAFVNAGMNQFKNIFIGKQEPKFNKAANSQKCIRVGGRHNDINIVGNDGYHHTFFEMLGNWSFGDYFKAEACELAWKLLTEVYKLPPQRLYVTYFGGDKNLSLEEDFETKAVWQSLGVESSRVIPFGIKENFWEMGDYGPCGPCTEIHYDHMGLLNRKNFVNKGLFDLTELWNIVFIEHYRNLNGTITLLPNKHVDTGMGFERLTAILQGKTSNYDTDNFSYLMDAIEKISGKTQKYEEKYGEADWNGLNATYRTLADHSRMITVCLADGIIPEQNQKLRRIMRNCFKMSENVFQKKNGLLKELSNYVVDNLGPIYPEMEKNILQIHQIIDYEEEVYEDLKNNILKEWDNMVKTNSKLESLDILEKPSLLPAFKDLCKTKPNEINGDVAFKLYDTFGLSIEGISELSEILNLSFNKNELQFKLNKAKERSREQSKIQNKELFNTLSVPKTDDSYKYHCKKFKDTYEFDSVQVKVLKIINENNSVDYIEPGIFCHLLLDKTNFYSEAGGQISDKGQILLGNGIFSVKDTENYNNYILHEGIFKSQEKLFVNSIGTSSIDKEIRLNIMRNHTATHLLNSVLKKLYGVTCQKSSKVTDEFLNLDVAIFGLKLTIKDIKKIEDKVNEIINQNITVEINEINSQKFLEYNDITVIPGEIYPDENIRIIEIKNDENLISREPCCGTHVFHTKDIEKFSIIKMKYLGRSTVSFFAVTGPKAQIAMNNSQKLINEVKKLQKKVPENIDKGDVLQSAISSVRKKISEHILIPVTIKHDCLENLNTINKQIKNMTKGTLNDFIDMEIQSILNTNIQITKSNKKFIIHYLRTSMILDKVPLSRATKICKNIPILVISYNDNKVHSRCSVPKEYCTDKFSADAWMQSVVDVFQSTIMDVKGQNNKYICNMKSKHVNIQDWDLMLKNCLTVAKEFITNNL